MEEIKIKEGYINGCIRVTHIAGWYKLLKLGSLPVDQIELLLLDFLDNEDMGPVLEKALKTRINHDVLDKKKKIGTEVHEAIEGYYDGIFVPLSEKAKGYFESFKIWVAENPYIVAHQEKRFFCDKLMITGAVDMITMTKKGLKIIDFKTSSVADPRGWEVQAAFYMYLTKLDIVSTTFVKLDKDGKKPKIFEFKPSQESWEIALQCYRLYKFWNE